METRSDGPTTLEVVFDYVDPGSWLVFLHLENESQAEGGPPLPGATVSAPTVRWRPLELRPPGTPPLDPADPTWLAMTEALLDEARTLGFLSEGFSEPTSNRPALPHTRKAHELGLHAAEQGAFPAVHRKLFEAHFVHGEDLGRIDLLVEIARQVGMDPGLARTVLGVDRFAPAVETERAELLAAGVRGVPTLHFPGKPEMPPVEGYPGHAPLVEALQRGSRPPEAAVLPRSDPRSAPPPLSSSND